MVRERPARGVESPAGKSADHGTWQRPGLYTRRAGSRLRRRVLSLESWRGVYGRRPCRPAGIRITRRTDPTPVVGPDVHRALSAAHRPARWLSRPPRETSGER